MGAVKVHWVIDTTDIGRLLFVLLVLATAGCSTVPSLRPADPDTANLARVDELGECARQFAHLDDLVARFGVADAQSARIPGFPYLRASRFLASSIKPQPGAAAFEAWVDALRQLDREARKIEHANLPVGAREDFGDNGMDECAQLLRRNDLSGPLGETKLHETVNVPDSYRASQRVLGLYLFTSIPFELGVRRLHRDLEETLSQPAASIPVEGTLTRYASDTKIEELTAAEVKTIIGRSSDNPLAVPRPDEQDLSRLFSAFAPIWEVDVVSSDDLVGAPYWPTDSTIPGVNPHEPVTYTLLSHTRLGEEALLQLNYIIWFPARPRAGRFDLFAGRVDGITWRVTLRADGEVAFYDSVHNCGCYHVAFTTPNVRVLRRQSGHEEPLLIAPLALAVSGHPVIRVQHATHYIQQVYFNHASGAQSTFYPLRSYNELRSLPRLPGQRRSFFRSDGLVSGTERGERWLFWPMGVPEPGAMRQWGTHAIAFVGRRHFDDPYLFAPYLELLP